MSRLIGVSNNTKLKMKKLLIFFVLVVLVGIALIFNLNKSGVKIKFNEKHYQTLLCKKLGGVMEFKLKDNTRVDCLTDDYAIEVDWAKKWAEGIGQSLYYAEMTNKKPAVALIVGKKDQRYLKRINKVASKVGITIIEINK